MKLLLTVINALLHTFQNFGKKSYILSTLCIIVAKYATYYLGDHLSNL